MCLTYKEAHRRQLHSNARARRGHTDGARALTATEQAVNNPGTTPTCADSHHVTFSGTGYKYPEPKPLQQPTSTTDEGTQEANTDIGRHYGKVV